MAPEFQHEAAAPPNMLDTTEAPPASASLSSTEEATAVRHTHSPSAAKSASTQATAIPSPSKDAMLGRNHSSFPSWPTTYLREIPPVASGFLLSVVAGDASSDSEDEQRRRRPGWRQEDSDSDESMRWRFRSSLRTGRRKLLGQDMTGPCAHALHKTAPGATVEDPQAEAAAII